MAYLLSVSLFEDACNYISIACLPGYYGNDCNNQCGKCAGNAVCDSHSGNCSRGCRENWLAPKCNGKIFAIRFAYTYKIYRKNTVFICLI